MQTSLAFAEAYVPLNFKHLHTLLLILFAINTYKSQSIRHERINQKNESEHNPLSGEDQVINRVCLYLGSRDFAAASATVELHKTISSSWLTRQYRVHPRTKHARVRVVVRCFI